MPKTKKRINVKNLPKTKQELTPGQTRRVKVGKLNLNKETVKDLTASEQKQLKGAVAPKTAKCGDFPRTVDTVCNCA